MGYAFSQRSIRNIESTNRILQELAKSIIVRSEYDFGVLDNGGLRTAEQQNELYQQGSSQCDGYVKKSYHQSGLAIDFVPYINGNYTWSDAAAFLHIAGLALQEFNSIERGNYYLHWGGFWSAKDINDNGLLDINDELGWDMPHFELRTYPQTRGFYPVKWNES